MAVSILQCVRLSSRQPIQAAQQLAEHVCGGSECKAPSLAASQLNPLRQPRAIRR